MFGPGERDWASSARLVATNSLPLVGVLALGWRVETLLLWYWIDAGVAGAAAIPRIRRAEGEDDPEELPSWIYLDNQPLDSLVGRDGEWLASAFGTDYALWWGFVGLFALVVAASEVRPALLWQVPLVVAGTVVAHFVSYRENYVGRGVYGTTGPVTQALGPLRRLLALVLTVVVGLNFAVATGNGLFVVLALVLVKSGLDLLIG